MDRRSTSAPEVRPDRRLDGKAAIVVGAGQTPGETAGNGRAASILFARHGARVLLVDRDLAAAEATAAIVREEGGDAEATQADVLDEEACRAVSETCLERFGRIDVLHYNVGIGENDAGPTSLDAADWDRIHGTNTRGAFFCAKHVLPVMRRQGSGCLLFVSSAAAQASTGMVAYKTSKAALNALSQGIATGNARHGIRSNIIMPGLMNTPMAIEGFSKARGISREEVIAERDANVALAGGMGSAWDVAYAALFLASDEARFITGIALPVDGGALARRG
ncbi:MAG: SDR family oxidoreductase [Alphaproteobacteria bacterium]|nr:SDR family oxidoreductase [Alphaproteobacteria bacterium]